MSGGDPPLPPSRAHFHSSHGRPPHRRRGGASGASRNGWINRRPRSPPPAPSHVHRYMRTYEKHDRHLPLTPPSLSQGQYHATGYFPRFQPMPPPRPPLMLPQRHAQPRLRSRSPSPHRRTEFGFHRADSHQGREPAYQHRVDRMDPIPYRGGDPRSLRGPPLESRCDFQTFRPDHPSHREVSDHSSHRGEPGPLYRAEGPPHRDEFESRRLAGNHGMGNGEESPLNRSYHAYRHGPYFRNPSKINKMMHTKRKRTPPHLAEALRTPMMLLSKPESPSVSRLHHFSEGADTSYSRYNTEAVTSPMRKAFASAVGSVGFSHSPARLASRGVGKVDTPILTNTESPSGRAERGSPERQDSMKTMSISDERTNNDRGKRTKAPCHSAPVVDEGKFSVSDAVTPIKQLAAPSDEYQKKSREPAKTSDADTCNGAHSSNAHESKFEPGKGNVADTSIDGLVHEPLSAPAPSGKLESTQDGRLTSTEKATLEEDGPRDLVDAGTGHKCDQEKAPALPILNAHDEAKPSMGVDSLQRISKPGEDTGLASDSIPAKTADHSKVSGDNEDVPVSRTAMGALTTNELATTNITNRSSEPTTHRPVPGQLEAPNHVKPTGLFRATADLEEASRESEPINDDRLENEALRSPPATKPSAPVPVPAPALPLLRSAPKVRSLSSSFDGKLESINAFKKDAPAARVSGHLPVNGSSRRAPIASHDLVKQIHDVEGRILSLERVLSELKTSKSRKPEASPSPLPANSAPNEASTEWDHGMIARQIVDRVDERSSPKKVYRSVHPLHAEARLLLVRNQSCAFAAHAALRTLCHDVELGLDGYDSTNNGIISAVSDEVIAKVNIYLKEKKVAEAHRKKKMRREYRTMMDSWQRKLKSARDKRSKEKREAMRERDRFILLRTKGASALLTSRTSSGRTSTKLVPSVGANGQTDGAAELDARLAEIEAEGGTPGSKSIWSKTLAEIPEQDASRYPMDCHSVLMEDPIAEHHASRSVSPWHFEEVLVFLDKYVTSPKNFRKIASFLEHKTSVDCSYFYYMNKLRLNLKQLAKEASGMRRKGVLRQNLFQIARRFALLDGCDSSADSFMVPIQNSVAQSAAEKFMLCAESKDGSVFASKTVNSHYLNDRGDNVAIPLKRSERILLDSKAVDLTGIERKAFAEALDLHGTDWKAVSSHVGLVGKSSTHYREYYRRFKRRLEYDAVQEQGQPRVLSLGNSLKPKPKEGVQSRISPRTSPRTSTERMYETSNDVLDVRPGEMTQRRELAEQNCDAGSNDKRGQNSNVRSSKNELEPTKEEAGLAVSAAAKVDKDQRKGKATVAWTEEEGARFRILFKQLGRDWKAIAQLMTPKTPPQIKGYWRAVAHEVGDGISAEGSKAARLNKKRLRRRSSSEALLPLSPCPPRVNKAEPQLRKSEVDEKPLPAGHNEDRLEGHSVKRDGMRNHSDVLGNLAQAAGHPEIHPEQAQMRLPTLRSHPALDTSMPSKIPESVNFETRVEGASVGLPSLSTELRMPSELSQNGTEHDGHRPKEPDLTALRDKEKGSDHSMEQLQSD